MIWPITTYIVKQKAFKAFIKPFETPQRSVEIKIEYNFLKCTGREVLNSKMLFEIWMLF